MFTLSASYSTYATRYSKMLPIMDSPMQTEDFNLSNEKLKEVQENIRLTCKDLLAAVACQSPIQEQLLNLLRNQSKIVQFLQQSLTHFTSIITKEPVNRELLFDTCGDAFFYNVGESIMIVVECCCASGKETSAKLAGNKDINLQKILDTSYKATSSLLLQYLEFLSNHRPVIEIHDHPLWLCTYQKTISLVCNSLLSIADRSALDLPMLNIAWKYFVKFAIENRCSMTDNTLQVSKAILLLITGTLTNFRIILRSVPKMAESTNGSLKIVNRHMTLVRFYLSHTFSFIKEFANMVISDNGESLRRIYVLLCILGSHLPPSLSNAILPCTINSQIECHIRPPFEQIVRALFLNEAVGLEQRKCLIYGFTADFLLPFAHGVEDLTQEELVRGKLQVLDILWQNFHELPKAIQCMTISSGGGPSPQWNCTASTGFCMLKEYLGLLDACSSSLLFLSTTRTGNGESTTGSFYENALSILCIIPILADSFKTWENRMLEALLCARTNFLPILITDAWGYIAKELPVEVVSMEILCIVSLIRSMQCNEPACSRLLQLLIVLFDALSPTQQIMLTSEICKEYLQSENGDMANMQLISLIPLNLQKEMVLFAIEKCLYSWNLLGEQLRESSDDIVFDVFYMMYIPIACMANLIFSFSEERDTTIQKSLDDVTALCIRCLNNSLQFVESKFSKEGEEQPSSNIFMKVAIVLQSHIDLLSALVPQSADNVTKILEIIDEWLSSPKIAFLTSGVAICKLLKKIAIIKFPENIKDQAFQILDRIFKVLLLSDNWLVANEALSMMVCFANFSAHAEWVEELVPVEAKINLMKFISKEPYAQGEVVKEFSFFRCLTDKYPRRWRHLDSLICEQELSNDMMGEPSIIEGLTTEEVNAFVRLSQRIIGSCGGGFKVEERLKNLRLK